MKKNKFDIEYKNWLSQVDEPADESLWDEIENELDFVESWENISNELDSRLAKKRVVPLFVYWKEAIAVAAMIFLIISPVKIINEYIIPSGDNIDNIAAWFEPNLGKSIVNNVEPEFSETYIGMNIQGFNAVDVKIEEGVFNYLDNALELAQNDFDNNLLKNLNESINAELYMLKLNMDYSIFENIPAIVSISDKDDKFDDSFAQLFPDEKSSSFFRIVDVGFVYGYKNTWLLNHETRKGLDPTKLGNTVLTFHYDIGASSTWAINGKPAIGIEFLWRSETGQKYQQYINASFVDKEINLRYMKLQSYYIYDYKNIPGQSLIGGYVAKLDIGEETQGEKKFNVNQNYSDYDYGVFLGYEINIPVYNKLVFTPGLRVSYNLVNIFEGDDNIPGYLKNTKNLSAGFNLAVSYRIFK